MKRFKASFGKAKIEINKKDLSIREFKALLTNLATCIVVLGNENKIEFTLVSIDMTSITNRDQTIFKDKVANILNLNNEHIWLIVTHTFSAPHLKRSLKTIQDKSTYKKYLDKILASISVATEEAKADFQDVKIIYREIACPLNVNRNINTQHGYRLGRNFAGYSNHQLRVIEFDKLDGQKDIIEFLRNFGYNLAYEISNCEKFK